MEFIASLSHRMGHTVRFYRNLVNGQIDTVSNDLGHKSRTINNARSYWYELVGAGYVRVDA